MLSVLQHQPITGSRHSNGALKDRPSHWSQVQAAVGTAYKGDGIRRAKAAPVPAVPVCSSGRCTRSARGSRYLRCVPAQGRSTGPTYLLGTSPLCFCSDARWRRQRSTEYRPYEVHGTLSPLAQKKAPSVDRHQKAPPISSHRGRLKMLANGSACGRRLVTFFFFSLCAWQQPKGRGPQCCSVRLGARDYCCSCSR